MPELGNPWMPHDPYDSPQHELVRALAKAESALALGSSATPEPPVVAIPPTQVSHSPPSAACSVANKSPISAMRTTACEPNCHQDERTKRLLKNEDTLRQLAEGAHRLLLQAKMEGEHRWDDPTLLVRGSRRT